MVRFVTAEGWSTRERERLTARNRVREAGDCRESRKKKQDCRVLTCLVLLVLEFNVQLLHGIMDKPERLHNVLKHNRLPLNLLVLAEPLSIY